MGSKVTTILRKAAIGAASALVLGLAAASVTPATAQSGGGQCGVQQAAQAALQRRLAVIDAAKVNPSDFFTGPNSCIDSGLLQSFDLSRVIPDLAGFLNGGLQGIAQQAINQAKSKICDVLNEQISKVLEKINSKVAEFSSKIGELSNLMGGNFEITPPGTSGFGQYNMAGGGGSYENFDYDGLKDAIANMPVVPTSTSGGTSGSSSVVPLNGSSSATTTTNPAVQSTIGPQGGDATTTKPTTRSGGASWLN